LKLETRNCLLRCNRFGLFRFRSPLLSESRLLSFPPGTEMVHFPGFARARLWIQRTVSWFYQDGFPHSEIPGSKPACGSPRLIAACHVLLRLLLPRHPPCALSSLTIKFTQRMPSCSFVETVTSLQRHGRLRRNSTAPLSAHRTRLIYSSHAHQQTCKAHIKNYSPLYLPNLFSCQTSSVACCLGSHQKRKVSSFRFPVSNA
jgi:hypothetical protein